jgi:MalT-like TPR region
MAEVAYQRNQLDTALQHLDRGIEPCRLLVYRQPLATGLATLAWIRLAAGDWPGAEDAADEARRCAPSSRWQACSIPYRRSWHGSSWPVATWPQPPAGPGTGTSTPTTIPAIPESRTT